MSAERKEGSTAMIILAFAILYIVWGSTYFFIALGIKTIPPLMLGAIRFLMAGLLMMGWCVLNKESLFNWKQIQHSAVTGFFLLFIGTGAVIWAEQTLASSLVAVLIASQAIWFVLMDKRNWKNNFTNAKTVIGLIIGFIGVLLLFKDSASKALSGSTGWATIIGLIVLLVGMLSWSGGSVYTKYTSTGSSTVNSAWQMFLAGSFFLVASCFTNEWNGFQWSSVTSESWWAVAYLVVMGSLAGFSAYVWLLKVRPVTQVSTHVYVNPLVAVLLGVFFANEKMNTTQVAGLAIILTSVLLINLAKYKKPKTSPKQAEDLESTIKVKTIPTKMPVTAECS